mgnify:CR=1 FL=1|tara:strand:- start:16 stop:177 length:162 start_codon:yes stop_codon:yes gene_type:complete
MRLLASLLVDIVWDVFICLFLVSLVLHFDFSLAFLLAIPVILVIRWNLFILLR